MVLGEVDCTLQVVLYDCRYRFNRYLVRSASPFQVLPIRRTVEIFRLLHSGTPAKIHFLSAVRAIQHSRQRTHFAHIGGTAFVLAYLLNGVKGLLVYDCFLRILEDNPIFFR